MFIFTGIDEQQSCDDNMSIINNNEGQKLSMLLVYLVFFRRFWCYNCLSLVLLSTTLSSVI